LLLGVRRSPVQRLLARFVLSRADYVTCVSAPLVQAARALGVPAERVELAPRGIDIAHFHPGEASSVRPPVVLSLRGIHPVYNPLVIARAIPAVLAHRPDAYFLICTYSVDAALLARFRQIVAQAGSADSVAYIGDLRDDQAIADLCRRAAVAVSVPSSDGTPQSVLEAMACGAVPVLSDLPSLRDWVRPEVEGLFVPVGDAEALAAAILRLLNDQALRSSAQAAAVQRVRALADRHVRMQRYDHIYRELAAGRVPRPVAVNFGQAPAPSGVWQGSVQE
jgi:glycosyltransferase involved in cell wall biosynthesis